MTGYQPDVFSDIDFHNEGCDASQYRCLVLSTHPEYWSRQMYDNLAAYLDAGGSVLYLGGNGIYENGEYEPGQTGMIFRAGLEGGPRVSALFRVLTPPSPSVRCWALRPSAAAWSAPPTRSKSPTTLCSPASASRDAVTGVRAAGGQRRSVRRDRAQHRLRQRQGQRLGSRHVRRCRCGHRADQLRNRGQPDSRIQPPDGLQVLASGEADFEGPGAEMVFYEHTGGGIVFSVGSLTFGGSLVVDRTIQQLMRNVLTRAGVT